MAPELTGADGPALAAPSQPGPDRADEQRRHALGQFLRSRRQRISPTAHGFPEGRRRTPGLRREELASLAGISPTWYTYLEQGRDVRPSLGVLGDLADVLRLDDSERDYLRVAAGAVAHSVTGPPPEDVSDNIAALIRAQADPCYLCDSLGDVFTWNDAAAQWYGLADLPVDRRNILWWMFNHPEARWRLLDWEFEVRDALGRVRGAHIRHGDFHIEHTHPAIREVLAHHEQARTWWQEMQVRGQIGRSRRMRHPDGHVRTFHLLPLFHLPHPDRGVLFHVPTGDAPVEVSGEGNSNNVDFHQPQR